MNIVREILDSYANNMFILDGNDEEQLLDMIKNHMGIYTPKEYEKSIESYTTSELIVYYADILASQKNQNHLPYIEEMHKNVVEILA